jgi:hypothetical protein
MNCAPVTVVGTSSSFTGPRMFEANIFGGTCITVEGVDVVYPNPGSSVQFGGAFVGGKTGPPTVLTPCNFDQNQNLTVTGSGTTSVGASDTAGDPPPVVSSIPSSFYHTDLRFIIFNKWNCFRSGACSIHEHIHRH